VQNPLRILLVLSQPDVSFSGYVTSPSAASTPGFPRGCRTPRVRLWNLRKVSRNLQYPPEVGPGTRRGTLVVYSIYALNRCLGCFRLRGPGLCGLGIRHYFVLFSNQKAKKLRTNDGRLTTIRALLLHRPRRVLFPQRHVKKSLRRQYVHRQPAMPQCYTYSELCQPFQVQQLPAHRNL